MSAFVVPPEHVHVLLATALRGTTPRPHHRLSWSAPCWFVGEPVTLEEFTEARRTIDHANADHVGQMLFDANVASVRHRYGPRCEDMIPPDAADYRWIDPGVRLSAVEALKAIDCFVYQACEPPSWHDSKAQRFCDALRDLLIGWLPGYEEAPWDWCAHHVEARRLDRVAGSPT